MSQEKQDWKINIQFLFQVNMHMLEYVDFTQCKILYAQATTLAIYQNISWKLSSPDGSKETKSTVATKKIH